MTRGWKIMIHFQFQHPIKEKAECSHPGSLFAVRRRAVPVSSAEAIRDPDVSGNEIPK